MQQLILASVILFSQMLFPGIVDEVVLVPTTYEVEDKIEVYYEPIEIGQLPLSKERLPQKTNEESLGPVVSADSAIMVDYNTMLPLWQKNPDAVMSIASLTKLMTALVLMDLDLDWTQSIDITDTDNNTDGSRLRVPTGAKVSLEDLLRGMLVGSANNATMSLVNATGLGHDAFVVKMNEKADELGLENTSFVEPTGLNENNISTVSEYMVIAKQAFS